MNTLYEQNPYARFGAVGHAGVNLEQLFVSPTAAYQIAPGHTIGISVNVAYQMFSSRGIGVFAPFSAAPANLSNRSTDQLVRRRRAHRLPRAHHLAIVARRVLAIQDLHGQIRQISRPVRRQRQF
ncbi:MAG: hypothetical protein WDN04_00165 [Rhodospirillales bacterium]